MKKKWLILILAVILLVSVLPLPKRLKTTYHGINTENAEPVTITLRMNYLRFLFLKNQMYGTVTVDTPNETYTYGEYLHYVGQSPSVNNAGEKTHDFNGWYFNGTTYMKEYEDGTISPMPIGFEGVLVHLSPDFQKILILHTPGKDNNTMGKCRYIGNVEKNRETETQNYFSGYYDQNSSEKTIN